MPLAVAAVSSSPLVVGRMSFLTPALRVPRKLGEPLQPELVFFQPGSTPEISTLSVGLRPNTGVPHTRRSSLVWNGPLTLSPVTNWISSQMLGLRAAR